MASPLDRGCPALTPRGRFVPRKANRWGTAKQAGEASPGARTARAPNLPAVATVQSIITQVIVARAMWTQTMPATDRGPPGRRWLCGVHPAGVLRLDPHTATVGVSVQWRGDGGRSARSCLLRRSKERLEVEGRAWEA